MSASIGRATDLRPLEMHDFGPHYATTLRHWRERFIDQHDAVRDLGFPESFIRLWLYYLCYCEAGFAERYIGVVHLLLAKPGAHRQPERAGRQTEA